MAHTNYGNAERSRWAILLAKTSTHFLQRHRCGIHLSSMLFPMFLLVNVTKWICWLNGAGQEATSTEFSFRVVSWYIWKEHSAVLWISSHFGIREAIAYCLRLINRQVTVSMVAASRQLVLMFVFLSLWMLYMKWLSILFGYFAFLYHLEGIHPSFGSCKQNSLTTKTRIRSWSLANLLI